MKKLLLLLVTMLLPMVASADESGTCGEKLIWTYVESTQTLTISGEGEMAYDLFSGGPWINHAKTIQNIVIEDGVTSIMQGAFSGFICLTSIIIPNSVTNIGSAALSGCSSLSDIHLPDKLTKISKALFYGCVNLTSVDMPCGLDSIGNAAFKESEFNYILYYQSYKSC